MGHCCYNILLNLTTIKPEQYFPKNMYLKRLLVYIITKHITVWLSNTLISIISILISNKFNNVIMIIIFILIDIYQCYLTLRIVNYYNCILSHIVCYLISYVISYRMLSHIVCYLISYVISYRILGDTLGRKTSFYSTLALSIVE